jgi:raffinose/stachyose/melibiose transport system permease protein
MIKTKGLALGTVAIVASVVVFIVPFAFIVLTASKTQQEASLLQFSWPTEWVFFQNLAAVISTGNYILIRAFINSVILTVVSVAVMVILAAMVGYILQRRSSKWNGFVNFLVLAGLIIPPAAGYRTFQNTSRTHCGSYRTRLTILRAALQGICCNNSQRARRGGSP